MLWSLNIAWPELQSVPIDDELTVSWVLALPITESERRFLADEGYRALTERFAAEDIDYLDLHRPSVV